MKGLDATDALHTLVGVVHAVQYIFGLESGMATAVGTMLLAIVTLGSLFFAGRALRATQKTIGISQAQLQQTQREIELSRQEVEEAHRPVLVPVADGTSFMNLGADGSALERRPQLIRAGRIVVPIENIGSGPALNVVATVSGTTLPNDATVDFQTAAKMSGLGVGSFAPLVIELPTWKELWSFTLTIEYSDVAGKGWSTTSLYLRETGRYDAMAIARCERKPPSSDMLRPVLPS